ncbi:hypothetical protein BN863_11650 [Formosa agariphila KMM 3901]|uniref:Uncharacterized protein n=1 Tax=Formosa agariphila (strain DSM 15362 / KCTC 12365 / LMG 23005 / KMM 3901 / M-2Alg 35-1) TaxID=1347342 RepID=T2KJ25_FORAG|nr:hypothetical protein [Formosa agariphila]CDF78877.1 hypothetical protein BN863_11650 [Formosa agariphila KMM 3901]
MKPSILIGAASIIMKNKKLRIAFIALQLGYLAHTYLERKSKKKELLTH